jgi:hypothetical protein
VSIGQVKGGASENNNADYQSVMYSRGLGNSEIAVRDSSFSQDNYEDNDEVSFEIMDKYARQANITVVN